MSIYNNIDEIFRNINTSSPPQTSGDRPHASYPKFSDYTSRPIGWGARFIPTRSIPTSVIPTRAIPTPRPERSRQLKESGQLAH